MISVIIPYMAIWPYTDTVEMCLESLSKQTEKLEVVVVAQQEQRYIRKNWLYNKGIEATTGDVIWFCDADFTLEDKDFLKNMSAELTEVIYPFFESKRNGLKVADGGPMFTRDVIKRHGPLNEGLLGISWVTFPFMEWCMHNTDCKLEPKFVLTHNGLFCGKRRHGSTGMKMRPIYKKVQNDLSDMQS